MAALMGQPKPQASLSSSLLARKGQARPAMRPQGFAGFGNLADAIDDLGWNDMEGDAAARVAQHPAGPAKSPVMIEEPPVLREREALKAEIETPGSAQASAMSDTALTRIGRNVRAKQTKAKSAFTLRLDAERHLRLRLASAVADRSAQQLVTEALDAFLATLPEVEALAQSLPPNGRKSRGK